MGTVIGWSSPAGQLIKEKLKVGDEDIAWVSSIMPLGAACAAIFLGIVLDRLGRRNSMLVLAPPFIIGWLILGFANSIVMYCVGRFITGFCGGGFCVAAPTYIGEISDKGIRGTLGVFFQLLLVIGIALTYCLGMAKSLMVCAQLYILKFKRTNLKISLYNLLILSSCFTK